jgi:hypothetical protein
MFGLEMLREPQWRRILFKIFTLIFLNSALTYCEANKHGLDLIPIL